MIKLIACDLDETLLDSDHKLSEDNARAIKRAEEAGAAFVPATGRGWTSLGYELEALGHKGVPGRYCITLNGGAVMEHASERLIASTPFDFGTADALWRAGAERGLCMHVYTLGGVWIYGIDEDEQNYVGRRMPSVLTDETDLGFIAGEKIMKVLFQNTDMGLLARVSEELKELTRGLDVTYSANRYLEFNPGGVNKGQGLLALAAHLGVDAADTMAIGDSSNDLSMICAAGTGVAVANATSEVKAAADYVCAATNDQSAVAEAIERFVLA